MNDNNFDKLLGDYKEQTANYHKLDKSVAVIENRLEKIEELVDEIAKSLQSINVQFSKNDGASAMKYKAWTIAYSSLTIITTLGLHHYFFKG